MANLYYRESLRDADFAPGTLVEVDGDEGRHAVRVSRLRAGERILVGNGSGTLGDCVVSEVEKDRFVARVESARTVPAVFPRLVLVQALAKGDRDERAVEQATEYGVDTIVPWEAERSISRWGTGDGSKAERGAAKWQRIAREASKQSIRARIPGVRGPVSLQQLIEVSTGVGSEVCVLHPRGGRPMSEIAQAFASLNAGSTATPAVTDIWFVVGPEGGLSDREVEALEAAGASFATLGDTVLRTSSAGSAAIAVVNAALGRW